MGFVPFNARRMAAICGAAVFVTFLFAYNLVMGSGLIPGADAAVDARTEKLEDAAERRATIEGTFVDCTGAPISESKGAGEPAVLRFEESYSYLIGYNSKKYGTSGLRSRLHEYLYRGGSDYTGAQVRLTTHNALQEYCYQLLEGSEGSIIVMNAETGALLACASRSDAEVGYNVNEIDTHFETYNSIDTFFLNRAVMAQDPEGSTFKILTTAAMVENGLEDHVYDDLDGTFSVGGAVIHNYRGECFGAGLDLQTALKKSANVYFASAGVALGPQNLQATAQRFLLGTPVELDFATLRSEFALGDLNDPVLLAETAYGQGQVVASPMQIAMMMAAVVNDGVMMKPYILEEIIDDGSSVYRGTHEKISQALTADTAQRVQVYLHETAKYYGFSQEVYGTVYAKTGTADQSGGGNHLYYLMGVDTPDGSYVILADRRNAQSSSSALKNTATSVLVYLLSM